MKENAIIIDGVKHTLVKDNPKAADCLSCSLQSKCKNDLCNLLYDVSDCHFEILNRE